MSEKILYLFFFAFGIAFHIAGQGTNDFQQTILKSNNLKVKIYLPDTINGYYRSTRFDWSGVISSIKYNTHEYFGEWNEPHDPFVHDAITGPVEEFSPIGYEDAKVGETFLKIGVGILEKPNENQYHFSHKYKITNHGTWKTEIRKKSVKFTHIIESVNGYAYEYTKVLKIKKGKPELVLAHSLKNIGLKEINTTVYDHNMFTIDNTSPGKNYTITFPFDLKFKNKSLGLDSLLELNGNYIRYKKDLVKGDRTRFDLLGYGHSKKDYSIKIENFLTKAGVKITGNRPIFQLAYWSIHTVLSPEPYIKLSIPPNEKSTWDIHYTFYQIKP